MQITTAGMVGKLDPTGRDQLIADITAALVSQQEQADVTKKLAERANQGKAIFAAVGTIFGLIAGCALALIFMNDEWRAFQALKTLHNSSTTTAVAYDHNKLLNGLDLPDFSSFVLQSDLSSTVSGLGFVRFGDQLQISDAREPSIALTRWNTKIVEALKDNRTDLAENWTRTWIFKKVAP